MLDYFFFSMNLPAQHYLCRRALGNVVATCFMLSHFYLLLLLVGVRGEKSLQEKKVIKRRVSAEFC